MLKMRRIGIILIVLFITIDNYAQNTSKDAILNAATKMLRADGKLKIGGYGQIDYNQPFGNDVRSNGKLDVHRLVMLFGYKFNDRTQFITELEFEHVKEVYVEQAFLDYRITNSIHFRGGLMLIPMGITNEYHEPTTYHGVERPMLDKYICPTTWREIGAGFTGNLIDQGLRYQFYVVNGFKSYYKKDDGSYGASLRAKDGLRKGRQKGAESTMSSPNIAAKIEYYALPNLNLGLSGYFGDTQSELYNGLDEDNSDDKAKADSSVIGVAMIGVDARYRANGLELKAQYYYTSLSNTEQFNKLAGKNLGSAMTGYYVEAAYNVFHTLQKMKTELLPFVRYSAYNTQHDMESGFTADDKYDQTVITTGLGWKMSRGAILKADMQFIKTGASDDYTNTFNLGIGIWF